MAQAFFWPLKDTTWKWNKLDYQLLFRKLAHGSRLDSRDRWKLSLKTEIRALFYYYFFKCTPSEDRILDFIPLSEMTSIPDLFILEAPWECVNQFEALTSPVWCYVIGYFPLCQKIWQLSAGNQMERSVLAWPDYLGSHLKVVHFAWSDWLNWNLLFYFDKPVLCPTSLQ